MQKKRSYIDTNKCQLCDMCCDKCPARVNCPTKAITQEESGEPLYVDIQCTGCGKCVRNCLRAAISLM